MAITDKDAVLILGAGASSQFNLPVGRGLLDKVRGKIKTELENITAISPPSVLQILHRRNNPTNPRYNYRSYPILGTYLLQLTAEQQAEHQNFNLIVSEARRAVDFLTSQTADTIDAFIAQNPSVSRIVKIAIASIFFETLYTFNEMNNIHVWQLRPLFGRVLKKERNWVHLLVNLLRHAYIEKWVSEKNRLKIITFNYDTVLESVFDKVFTNTEIEIPPWKEIIDIVHMHGRMPYLDKAIEDHFLAIGEMAGSIEVATEKSPKREVQCNRDIARAWVNDASKIYACGYSFAGPNCRLLGLSKNGRFIAGGEPSYIRFCNYDGNPGLTNSAARYGVYEKGLATKQHPPLRLLIEDAPRNGEKLSITNWFYRGGPGELPA